MLGISADDTNFDLELIMHINGALMILSQLGVGPSEGYSIASNLDTWAEFIGARTDLALVKTAVFLRTKLIFDPPSNSFLVTAIEKQLAEYDWRIEAWHNPNYQGVTLNT